jgi:hypothetical protein
MQKWTYQQFLDFMKRHWKQGEHIALQGPTGSGKTFAARDLILLRQYIVIIATKAKDETLDTYLDKEASRQGLSFVKRQTWPPEWDEKRVLVWRKPRFLGDWATQQVLAYQVLDDVYRRGGWTLYLDDLYVLVNTMGLKRAMEMMYTQVRSNHVSIVASLQRPRGTILVAINQSAYVAMFKTHDEADVVRIAEEVGVDRRELVALNRALRKYEFLLLRPGEAVIHVAKKERTGA